jgi:hypothetical protein
MAQMRRTIRQMQNEITRLKRVENIVPPNQNVRVPVHGGGKYTTTKRKYFEYFR